MTAPAAPGSSRAPARDLTREAQNYLVAVECELSDLPAEERGDLLEDLEQHLASLVEEEEGDDRPLDVRLGSPVVYAAELRAAAGLPPRGGAQSSPDRVAQLRRWLARAQAHPLAGEVRRLLLELRPAWWVLRGYLLVAVPAAVSGDWDFPFPRPLGSEALGVLLVPAAIAGSVWLGRRELSPRLRVPVVAGGALLGLLGFVAVVDASPGPSVEYGYVSDYGYPAPGQERAVGQYPLVSRYGPVTDVLPYGADGTPLEGVLLYDQDGRPLEVGFQEWWIDGCTRELRQPLAADGVPVPNVFPQQYVLDGSGTGLDGAPVPLGACDATVQRPDVPLPQFPADPSVPEAPTAD
ncbi:HAAS signaling domain-containing protein [Modestobacter sp. SYSU DS0511]